MSFSCSLAGKNLKRKPFRSVAMAFLVLFLTAAVFSGAVIIRSLQEGLDSYRARLGADIVVVPYVASGSSTLEDILLQGAAENVYMKGQKVDQIREIEGVEQVSTQFYLTSAKADCCSAAVQIIGFDPETDFTIGPWVSESWDGELPDDWLIVGSDISVPEDGILRFYGNDYHVAATLTKSGTGLDTAVYTNMTTIRKMAESATVLMESGTFDNVSFKSSVSAVLVKVAEGYDISYVTGRINVLVSKVTATASRTMISDISDGLGRVSGIIGVLVGVVWVLAVLVLVILFALVANERKKEFAVLRVMGASKAMLVRVLVWEAVIVSGIGAVLGILLSIPVISLGTGLLKSSLSLPITLPPAAWLLLPGLGAVLLSFAAGIATALISAGRITRSETGLLLKEDV